MTTTEIEIEIDWAVIRKVAAQVQRGWAGYVDVDDLEQEGAIWWIGAGQKYLPGYLADDTSVRLTRSLWRVMARYAQKEKAAKVGYHPLDQYRYTPAEVVVLLGAALSPDGTPDYGGPSDGPKPGGNLAEGGDILAALIDVRRAIEALAEEDIHFLYVINDVRHDWDRAGELLNILPKSVQRRHTRVIERMCRWLNNEENNA